jgi:hypothetical protein
LAGNGGVSTGAEHRRPNSCEFVPERHRLPGLSSLLIGPGVEMLLPALATVGVRVEDRTVV